MSATVHLCRIAPDGYAHHRAFDEVADTAAWAIRTLGHTVDIVWNTLPDTGLNIVFGAHLLPAAQARALSPDTVVCNFEPIDLQTTFADWSRIDALRQATVWDYSARNVEYIRALTDNGRVTHVPIGYAPLLTRIPSAPVQDIDVLFYGSMNARRMALLDRLEARGLAVARVFGVYGTERDALIGRAKVVLNVHFYEARVFELVRVSYLLANSKAVVAECDARTELADDLRPGLCLAPYDELEEAVVRLVHDDAERQRLAQRGFDGIRARRADALVAAPLADALARNRPAHAG